MEDFRRPQRPAAVHQQRQIHYGREAVEQQPSHIAAPVQPAQPVMPAVTPPPPTISVDLRLQWPKFRRARALWHKLFTAQRRRKLRRVLSNLYLRVSLITMALVIVASQIYPLVEGFLTPHSYDLGRSEPLLQKTNESLGKKLEFSAKDNSFMFNQDYSPVNQTDSSAFGGAAIKATANADASKGLTVTDPNLNIDFTIKPQFQTLSGRQDQNRVVYPLMDGTGWMVYTMQAGGVKEDILLDHANGDTMKLKYTMDLADQGLEARLLPDGSVGVYGTSQPITGNVSTSTEKDAALLQKARNVAKKDKLVFSLPTPIVYNAGNAVSKAAKTHYEVQGDIITTVTTGLKKATFPLTVDPAVTVTSTADLFRDTTAESNIDLNATTGNASRGSVTGGVLGTWTTNANSLATSRFAQSATIYDDYIYVAGGIPQGGSTTPTTSIEFAHISSSDPSISSWSSTTSLPVGLARFQLLAYNGYLYAIGGTSVDNLCNTVLSSVYYIRIQSNGQLSGSWTTNTNSMPAGLCSFGATVYNGKIYTAGGQTGKQFNSSVTSVYYASINPDGSVGTFTTSSVVLPAATSGNDLRAYNGYLYTMGGATGGGGGGTTNAVYYAAIASDGSIYGSSSSDWHATTAFTTARSNLGSAFTFAYDGFMYLVGGCNTFNASFNCSVPQQDVQIAQINADGSLGTWSTNSQAQLASTVVGESIISSRGNVYNIAGCSTTASNVTCTAAVATQQYSAISVPGQVGPLVSATMTNLPASLMGHGATISNGFIYVAGGCVVNSCSGSGATAGTVYYASIAADGSVGAWTTDSTHPVGSGGFGLAFFGFTSANGYLYATGGFAATGASTSTNTTNIYYIKPNANGSLPGAWTASASLSAGRYGTSAVINQGFLYVLGGCTGNTATSSPACTAWSTVVNRFTLSGTTGAPSGINTTAIPTGTAFMGAAFYNGYIYLAGGQTGSSSYTNAIIYASSSGSGTLGTWTTATATLATNNINPSATANNGYFYVTGGYNTTGASVLGTIQSGQITMSTGDIASMVTSNTAFSARWGAATVFTNGFIYNLGGCTAGAPAVSCSARSNLNEAVEQYYASNKNTSAWTTNSTTYTTNRVTSSVTAYKGYIYVVGGCTSFAVTNFWLGCTNTTTSLLTSAYYAPLNPNGTIGTWSSAGNLPAGRAQGCLVAVGDTLYYIAGFLDSVAAGMANTPNASNGYFYSGIGTNGNPGGWTAGNRELGDTNTNWVTNAGVNRAAGSCAVFNNYIYFTGGVGASNVGTPSVSASVYHSADMSAGGNMDNGKPWTQMSSFTTARENHVALAAGGYLYVLGGDNKTTALTDTQYLQLDPSTGNGVGSWTSTTDLPGPISTGGAFAANGYVYMIGGRSAVATCLNTTQVASINSTGTLSNWSQSVNNLASARMGMGTAFYNGYYYSLGGHDCTAIISTNVVQDGGMRSQAMKGSFSKYADLNGDGRPEKLVIYLTNAKNNGVDVEKWKMVYKSSRDATGGTGWGVDTTVDPLVHENAYQVFAYNGSGTDQVVARYFQMTFSINQEQSFAFVDDSSRIPTIFQYGLHYAPPPSKRLFHGKDFRDQNQQGLDLKLGI